MMNSDFCARVAIRFCNLASAVLLAALLAVAEPAVGEPQVQPLRVGVILALTGDSSVQGHNIKSGIEHALEQLSEKERKMFVFFFEDDQLLPRSSVSAYNKLSKVTAIDVLINSSAGTAHAIAPLAERDEIPFFAIASDAKLVRDKKFCFLFWATPERIAEAVVEEAARRGIRRVAEIGTLHEGRLYLTEQFRQRAQGRFEIAYREEVTLDVRDFRSILHKIRQRKQVDALVLNLFFGQTGIFARQARELGITLPFFGFDLMGDAQEIESAKGALSGSWYAGAYEGSEEFKRKFRTRFPKATLFAAANGYDLVLLLKEPARNGLRGRQLIEHVRKQQEQQGALGSYRLLPDNRFDLPAEIRVIP